MSGSNPARGTRPSTSRQPVPGGLGKHPRDIGDKPGEGGRGSKEKYKVKVVYCPECGGRSVYENEPMLQFMEPWLYECPICKSRYAVYFKPRGDDPGAMTPIALIRLDAIDGDLGEIIEFVENLPRRLEAGAARHAGSSAAEEAARFSPPAPGRGRGGSRALEDAMSKWGRERVYRWIELAGHHARWFNPDVRTGETDEEKLIFALLEMLDFECYEYPSCPAQPVPSREEIKQFLLDHREAVASAKIDLPTTLGKLAGTFDFLLGEARG